MPTLVAYHHHYFHGNELFLILSQVSSSFIWSPASWICKPCCNTPAFIRLLRLGSRWAWMGGQVVRELLACVCISFLYSISWKIFTIGLNKRNQNRRRQKPSKNNQRRDKLRNIVWVAQCQPLRCANHSVNLQQKIAANSPRKIMRIGPGSERSTLRFSGIEPSYNHL